MKRAAIDAIGCVTASLALVACGPDAQGLESSAGPLKLERIVGGLEHPWSVAELPDGDFLITERPGRLRIASGGELRSIEGAPEVWARGQGGLLDVALAPDFESSSEIFLTYAKEGANGGAATALFAARLDGERLIDGRDLYVAEPYGSGGRHFGSRIAFDEQGLLYMSVGDRGERDRAQDLADPAGSILRLTRAGEPAPGNPDFGVEGSAPELYSVGHRNIQGLAFAEDGALYAQEHGPRGGDEINLALPGRNYGWPAVSYGREYWGPSISDEPTAAGIEPPLHQWTPSIAPSGLAIYEADAFEGWRGALINGALAYELIAVLDLEESGEAREERLLEGEIGRIRDVRVASDGALLILTDEADGALWRLSPE